jgi:hypothetical protein
MVWTCKMGEKKDSSKTWSDDVFRVLDDDYTWYGIFTFLLQTKGLGYIRCGSAYPVPFIR